MGQDTISQPGGTTSCPSTRLIGWGAIRATIYTLSCPQPVITDTCQECNICPNKICLSNLSMCGGARPRVSSARLASRAVIARRSSEQTPIPAQNARQMAPTGVAGDNDIWAKMSCGCSRHEGSDYAAEMRRFLSTVAGLGHMPPSAPPHLLPILRLGM